MSGLKGALDSSTGGVKEARGLHLDDGAAECLSVCIPTCIHTYSYIFTYTYIYIYICT